MTTPNPQLLAIAIPAQNNADIQIQDQLSKPVETTTYYNEFDPDAADWLGELFAAGQIPGGTIDLLRATSDAATPTQGGKTPEEAGYDN